MNYIILIAATLMAFFIASFIQMDGLKEVWKEAISYSPEGVSKFHVAGMWMLLGVVATLGYFLLH